MQDDSINILTTEFKKTFGGNPVNINPLPPSGSHRQYYRMYGNDYTCIGVYNPDYKENMAFISFSKTFKNINLPVPEIYSINLENHVYLIQDLGDTTLLDYINISDDNNKLDEKSINAYKNALSFLPIFQIEGGKKIDYSVCYPRSAFDYQSMMWDLNYFKYYFLKLANIPFDEQKLEDDFIKLSDFLLKSPSHYFMYRDFQSRNIMIVNNNPYFIDYQGGRHGALQYDIASILFEAKTSLCEHDREELLKHYVSILLSLNDKINIEEFYQYFYGYVYIRMMQAMGAYGFRGLYEKKELFLQSIPKALDHLKWLRSNIKLTISLPELEKVWDNLVENVRLRKLAHEATSLTVSINSFSYKRGIPNDETSNGGGFVFDCRSLDNPGRYEEYKNYTGLDAKVIHFLSERDDVKKFLNLVKLLVEQTINNYLQRNFKHLMVSFGCTGGRHRSVYLAECLSKFIKEKYPKINVIVRHRELEMYQS